MQNSESSSHGTNITMGDHYQNLTLIMVVAFKHFFMQNSVSSPHGANITMGDHYQNFIFGGFFLCIPIEDVRNSVEYMRARATISFILRTLDLTVLRANGKKMGCALFFALDCRTWGRT